MNIVIQHLAVDPSYFLRLQLPGKYFGSTIKLAIQFFITHGSEPIYDIYAHKGALAVDQNLRPGSTVAGYHAVQTWSDYRSFKCLLRRIGLQPSGNMFISRDDDRGIWVYGHLFK